jgi:hypothetical protein
LFSRKDTDTLFQWRIRNLHYPIDTYQISVDHATQEIVVRTTNKKYFKRIACSDLQVAKLTMDETSISYVHEHATLIISVRAEQCGAIGKIVCCLLCVLGHRARLWLFSDDLNSQYTKPKEILAQEAAQRQDRNKLVAKAAVPDPSAATKNGDVDCKTQ